MTHRLLLACWLLVALLAGLLITLSVPGPALAQDVGPAAPYQAQISDHLRQELAAADGLVSFLVILREQPDAGVLVSAAGEADATARHRALYSTLTAQAKLSQAGLRAWLDAQNIDYTPFYLVNMVEVHGDLALAEALSTWPEVDRLVRNPQIVQSNRTASALPPGWQEWEIQGAQATAALPYGLAQTQADAVWALGYRGQGIIVAGEDTGVEWEHPALQPAYRGWMTSTMTATHAYNWFDAWGRDPVLDSECPLDPQIPCDDDDVGFGTQPSRHGTHTMGTMVGDATSMGDTVLGMAPGAQWIACRNMRDGVGTPASYTACFQFFLAPYPQGGDAFTDGRPELAPHVINNSWGCPPEEGCDVNSLRQVVETLRAAGIFVVASAGNNGRNGCRTVLDPIAIHDATFSVGALDEAGTIAGFSSRGPVTVDGSNRLKPDLSAPGVSVRSAGHQNNGAYTYDNFLSGTSMAAPHLAGAAALLWSATPSLTRNIDLTEQVLIKSATPVYDASCLEGPQVPNPTYGYGRLNILSAVELAQHPVTFTLTVSNTSGTALSGRRVTLIDTLTGYRYTQLTNEQGQARWRPTLPGAILFAGEYTVTVEGSCPVTLASPVTLAEGVTDARGVTIHCRWLPVVENG
ncbi:MAG: S8 family serine peptidase [Caldilineaceae bacterium]|nr:S8 family serine peptidase [Caldilineaceae bacterium]